MSELESIFGHNGMIHDGHENIPDYAFNPDTVSVKDGNWNDPDVWSDGVPVEDSKVRISHSVRIKEEGTSGDLDGDGEVDVNDYIFWKKNLSSPITDLTRMLDNYFGLAPVFSNTATCLSCMVEPEGTLITTFGSILKICTLQVQGTFDNQYGFIQIRNLPIDVVFDPAQWGHGILFLSGSKWNSFGSIYVSENDEGVRGHIAALHTAHITVRDIVVQDFGRTTIDQLDNTQVKDGVAVHVGKNQFGRYPLHLHHLCGPKGLPDDEPQWLVDKARIYGSRKWGLVIHASHYGLAKDVKVDGADGAGISFEAGNEYKNTLIDCVATKIKGSGLGPQGRNNGLPIQNVGDGTVANPYRTIGDHGHEGGAIWGRGISNNIINCKVSYAEYGFSFWSRFHPKDKVQIPAFKGANPMDGETITVDAGLQHGCQFLGNKVSYCRYAANIQGLTGTTFIDALDVSECQDGLDTSYNGIIQLYNSKLKGTGTGWPMQHGFTAGWNLIDNVVTGWKGLFQLWNDFLVFRGEYDGIQIQYKHTPLRPRTLVMDGVKVTKQLSYVLGDYNKNRSYNMQNDVFVYNYQGVTGDNFQLWMLEQGPDFIPLKQPNPARITPENGLTNQQLFDKYGVCLTGKITPPTAITRPGIGGKITPIPENNIGSNLVTFSFSTSRDSIICQFKTDKPCRVRAEHSTGDIPLGAYTTLLLPVPPEYKTDHSIIFKGLKPNTTYNYILQTIDEEGNQGGDVRSTPSLKYVTRTAKTLA